MMKFWIFALVVLSACSAPADKFLITGRITGESPQNVYLKIYQDKKMQALDSAVVTNGQFRFTGKVDFPDQYFLQFGDPSRMMSLFVENASIGVEVFMDSLDKSVVKGSAVNDLYESLNSSKSFLYKQMDSIYTLFKTASLLEDKKLLESKLDSLDALGTEISKKFIKENPQSVLSPFIIDREIVYYLELEELEELVGGLATELAGYIHLQNLNQRIELLRTLQPGKEAPEFTQTDTSGNVVSLSDFKGKYLLIDFWASWCGPCRRANPTVVAAYEKFSPKGFTILGVSMDQDREKWLKAIAHDGLTWTQVSTLEGWNNPVGKLYGVNSIPHAILIDPDGKIVKRGLHAGELDSLLTELLK